MLPKTREFVPRVDVFFFVLLKCSESGCAFYNECIKHNIPYICYNNAPIRLKKQNNIIKQWRGILA